MEEITLEIAKMLSTSNLYLVAIRIFISGISMVGIDSRTMPRYRVPDRRWDRSGDTCLLVSLGPGKRYANFQLPLDAATRLEMQTNATDQSAKPRAEEHNGVVIR